MIEVIVGPMCAGKTSLLCQIAHRSWLGYEAYYACRENLQEAPNVIASRDGYSIAATPVGPGGFEYTWGNNTVDPIIVLDEIQFFDPGALFVFLDSVPWDKRVVCAGILSDHRRRPFPATAMAMSLAGGCLNGVLGGVTMLQANCVKCGRSSQFTKRLHSEHLEFLESRSVADYQVRCRGCWDL